MNIGNKIKYLRCQKRLTQEELALSANTTKQTIHKYETGIISNIPASKIKLIADKLDTTPAYLMGWEVNGSSINENSHDSNIYKVFAMNGKPGMHTTATDERQLDKMAQLLEIASELPSEKIDMLIKMAESIK